MYWLSNNLNFLECIGYQFLAAERLRNFLIKIAINMLVIGQTLNYLN